MAKFNKGDVYKVVGNTVCVGLSKGQTFTITEDDNYPSWNSCTGHEDEFENGTFVLLNHGLKVGDKVKLKDYSHYEFPRYKDQVATIDVVDNRSVHCVWEDGVGSVLSVDGPYLFGAYKVNNDNETKENDNMETTNTTPVEFVRLEKNTELYKKGEVFKYVPVYNYYEALNGSNALQDANDYVNTCIPTATVTRNPKVFAPVSKFNPEYVTAEENERLQAVLKPKAVKKTVKKATAKTAKETK